MSTPTLLTPAEVAEWLKVTEQTLRRWRSDGYGPPSYFVGPRAIRYRQDEVHAWLVEHGNAPPPTDTTDP